MTDNTSVCLLYHRFIPGRHGGLEKTRMMVDELISVVSKNPLKTRPVLTKLFDTLIDLFLYVPENSRENGRVIGKSLPVSLGDASVMRGDVNTDGVLVYLHPRITPL